MTSPYAWLIPPAYAELGERFVYRQPAKPVAAPALLYWNNALADALGLPAISASDAAALIGGIAGPAPLQSVATAYAGHQFGNFVPQLGDGRALLLGDIIAPDGRRFELQLKGSGRTPFSRGGDGRAALGPVLREVIVSEAMQALGVPTTRSLAAVLTGEQVMRERPVAGGVLGRLASSHVRVGSFEFFACRRDTDSLRALCDWTIGRHYPHCADAERPPLALLSAVIDAQATLIAQWMALGFVHGVMNTDNMTLSGETIDYGPCAFLDEYRADKVFSSIDHQGRYAYGNQPAIAQWNLSRLAECLLPLIHENEDAAIDLATAEIRRFVPAYEQAWLESMAAKFGLSEARPEDADLINGFLQALQEVEADYSLSFYALSQRLEYSPDGDEERSNMTTHLPKTAAMDAWQQAWRSRLSEQPDSNAEVVLRLRSSNPAVIPRNHQIERAIAAAYQGDMQVFHDLLQAVCRPFDDSESQRAYMQAPAPQQRVSQTFCGT